VLLEHIIKQLSILRRFRQEKISDRANQSSGKSLLKLRPTSCRKRLKHNAQTLRWISKLRQARGQAKGPINQLRIAWSWKPRSRREEFRKSNFGRDRYWLTCTSEDSARAPPLICLPPLVSPSFLPIFSLSFSHPPETCARSPFILGLQPRRKRVPAYFWRRNARYSLGAPHFSTPLSLSRPWRIFRDANRADCRRATAQRLPAINYFCCYYIMITYQTSDKFIWKSRWDKSYEYFYSL